MSLSDRIREVYRKNCNSMNEFAELLGVSKSSVEKWIHQDVNPRPDKLKKISEVFNVSIEWLQSGIDVVNEKDSPYKSCKNCKEKQKEIVWLKNQLDEKTDYIEMLKNEIINLKKLLK